MRNCGILVILLFLMTGCSAAAIPPEPVFSPSDRVFSQTEDPVLILTDATPEKVLEKLKASYPVVQVDFQSEKSLYATIHAKQVFRVAVVENDLDGAEDFLIMITYH